MSVCCNDSEYTSLIVNQKEKRGIIEPDCGTIFKREAADKLQPPDNEWLFYYFKTNRQHAIIQKGCNTSCLIFSKIAGN